MKKPPKPTPLPPIDAAASIAAWEKAAEHKPLKAVPRVYIKSEAKPVKTDTVAPPVTRKVKRK